MKLAGILVIYALVSASGLIMIKHALKEITFESITGFLSQAFQSWMLIVGFVLYLAGFMIWMYLLKQRDLSFIFPIVAGALYVAVFILSAIFLREQIGYMKILGATLILGGIILLFQFE